jgi:hypothetical protein
LAGDVLLPARAGDRRQKASHVLCQASWEPESLLAGAAREGFFRIPEAGIARLVAHVGLALPTGSDMFDKLKRLIQHALPGITDPDLHKILAKRLIGPSSEVLELFDDPEVQELFGADEQEIDKFTKTHQAAKVETEPFRVKFVALATSLGKKGSGGQSCCWKEESEGWPQEADAHQGGHLSH